METTKKTTQRKKLFTLCFCAAMIALATALSFVKMFEMPLGGSITLCSMLPIMLVSYFCGLGWGFAASFIFALGQAFISLGEVSGWGLSAAAFFGCMLLDYVLAYTSLGLAGVFKKKDATTKSHLVRFALGMLLAVAVRFFCHFLSGIILFSSWAAFKPEWLYSICYNGGFLLPDLIICVIVGFIVFTPIRKMFEKISK